MLRKSPLRSETGKLATEIFGSREPGLLLWAAVRPPISLNHPCHPSPATGPVLLSSFLLPPPPGHSAQPGSCCSDKKWKNCLSHLASNGQVLQVSPGSPPASHWREAHVMRMLAYVPNGFPDLQLFSLSPRGPGRTSPTSYRQGN